MSRSTPAPTASCPASCRCREGAALADAVRASSLSWISDPTPSRRLSSARPIVRRSASQPDRLRPPSRRADRRVQDRARGPGPGALRRCLQRQTPARIVGRHRQHAREEGVPGEGHGAGGRRLRPTGTTTDVQRLHREADRLFRAAGNRSGRARMRADGGSRPTYSTGLLISTGEEIPSGQSLRARLLVLELTPGEITAAASRRRRPTRREGCSLPPWRDICAGLRPASTISSDAAGAAAGAARHPGSGQRASAHARIAASLMLGWERSCGSPKRSERSLPVAASYAHAGARRPDGLGRGAAHAPGERGAGEALPGSARRGDQQRPRPPRRRGHRSAPEDAASLGLAASRRRSGRRAGGLAATGERVGWIRDDDLLLDPDAAFAAAQKLARDQGTSIPIKQRTLWKRLAEQGLLASRDGPGQNTVRHTIGACGAICCTFARACWPPKLTNRATKLTSTTKLTRRSAGKPRISGCGQFGQFGQKIEHRGPEESDLRDAVGWEVEI